MNDLIIVVHERRRYTQHLLAKGSKAVQANFIQVFFGCVPAAGTAAGALQNWAESDWLKGESFLLDACVGPANCI